MSKYLIYPIKWNVFGHRRPKIQCYCILFEESNNSIINKGRVFFEIDAGNTYYLKFNNNMTVDSVNDLLDEYDGSIGLISPSDDKIILIRNPDFNQTEDVGEWYDSKRNPNGYLYSFFLANEIKPYAPIKIVFDKGESMETSLINIGSSINFLLINEWNLKSKVQSNNDYSNIIENNVKKFYWDIEVFSADTDQFPDPRVLENEIIFISIFLSDPSVGTSEVYLLYLGTIGSIIDEDTISGYPVTFVDYENEKELIEGFYELLSDFSPDFIYGYNDMLFDYEYLYQRTILRKIDNYRKVSNNPKYQAQWREISVRTPFGYETTHTLDTPGTTKIDMMYYARRYFPGLYNHKLDTVSSLFIGSGKTGLKIADMMEYYRTQNPEGMRLAALYSIQDAVLLKQLDDKLNINDNLFELGNTCLTDIEDCLYLGKFNIAKRLMGSLDFSYLFNKLSKRDSKEININLNNHQVYSNLYLYDISNLYINSMSQSSDEIVQVLASLLVGLPTEIISTIYYSSFNTTFLESNNLINNYIANNQDIVSIDPNNLISLTPVNSLSFLYQYRKYVQLNNSNFFALLPNEELIKIGLNKIIRPTFDLTKNYIDSYLKHIFHVDYPMPEVSLDDIDDTDPEKLKKLVQTVRVKSSDKYKNQKSFRHILSKQYEDTKGKRILIWVSVQYLKLITGTDPDYILYDLYDIEDVNVDLAYYRKEFNNVRKEMNKIKKIN